MSTTIVRKLVKLDSRGRVSLAGIAQHKIYLVRVEPNGTIILEPADVLPKEGQS